MRLCKSACTALLAAGMALSALPAAAETTLRLHSVWVESRPVAEYLTYFSKKVEEHSKGDLKVQVFHGGSLGIKDADILRVLPSGAVDMSALYPEYVARDEPELAVAYVQGSIEAVDDQLKAVPAIQAIYAPVFEKWGITTLGAVQVPERSVHVFCKTPVRSLEDLKSKKIRVWGRHQVETFKRLGIAAQIIGQNDMYVALQTGVVDCATYMGSIATTISLQEVTPYAAYLQPHAGVPINLLISTKRFQALAPAQQEALRAAAADVLAYTNEEFTKGEREEAGLKKLADAGGKMLEPFSDADQAAFITAARATWKEMSEQVGPKAVANMNAILDAVK
ncbi:TRAP-type C4-dicarboxylate transport system, periplasmic component [Azospirillum argentinense]